jgi:hypothetical protein
MEMKGGDKRLKAVKSAYATGFIRQSSAIGECLLRGVYYMLGPVERRLYEVARSTSIDGAVAADIDELRLQLG